MIGYNRLVQRDIERILIPHAKIAQRVAELAGMITADHGGGADIPVRHPSEITIIPILTGAMIFTADLIRHLPMRMEIGLLAVSSYPGRSIRTQGSSILSEQIGDLRGRHVLLIDDIIDSGGTLRMVLDMLGEAGPESLKTCVLLRKPTPAALKMHIDYLGFEIPDEFVVGYGLDF